MINVTVRLYATLRKYTPHNNKPGEPFRVSLPEGSRLADLIAFLGLPSQETKQAFIRSRRQGEDYVLQDGDDIAIFPPIAGGQGIWYNAVKSLAALVSGDC